MVLKFYMQTEFTKNRFNAKKILYPKNNVSLVPVPHVDEGEDAVKGGHEDVCHAQV